MIGVAKGMRFSEVRQGMRARVVRVHSSSPEVRRLEEMGLTVGTEFTVVKVAPFGDPVEIDLRGYRLCLRRRESADFEIELVE
ncbi:MAG: ferrous iron transport protein A [Fimbriimonadaceae bacterium]|nr:ferrous iron transport protein A [Fimbriimonadaceae bacterium]